jgi:hypothetical protein
MTMNSVRQSGLMRLALMRSAMLLTVIACTASTFGQETGNPAAKRSAASNELENHSIGEIREQIRELRAAVDEMRSDWQTARAETAELRRQLDQLRTAKLQSSADISGTSSATSSGTSANFKKRANILPGAFESASGYQTQEEHAVRENDGRVNDQEIDEQQIDDQQIKQKEARKKNDRAARLEEEYQLLSGKVDDQYQTKVESASKYRVRLSGIVLMNMVSNYGTVDSIDLPTVAYVRPAGDSGGSFGATLRQSQIGLEAFGPSVAGARTTADLQLDLAGGFPAVPNGINSGLVRLRTATMRMDWSHTSIVAGQDQIFFSPNSPTSFASLAIPALSAAGNLWGWVPQIRVEHRVPVGEEANLIFQGGILDPVSGEAPNSGAYRIAGPGESSRQPAYATRIAWSGNAFGQPLRFGIGGFYNRQDYGFSRTVDGWAATTDLEIPLSEQFSLSGKFYRGKALGGFYGGVGRSVLFSDSPTLPGTQVQALNTVGGWAQLKYRPAIKWEFNVAFGMDNPFAADLKYFQYAQAYGDPALARNQGSFANLIYRPRSDLLFSAEYRRLTTYSLTEGRNNAGQLNLMMGVLF